MARAYFVKNIRNLVPADEDAENIMRKLGQGEVVQIEVRRERNGAHHRLLWTLIGLVYDNLPDEIRERWFINSKDDLMSQAKLAVGHYERRYLYVDGKAELNIELKSISYPALSQDDFSIFFDKVVEWLFTDVISGMGHDDLFEQARQMVGG